MNSAARWFGKYLRTGALASVAALGVIGIVPVGNAVADTVPPAGTPATVSADALPTWQINGVVWSQVTVGNTVYATGEFSTARPPGVAAGGAGEIAVGNLIAYDIRTGNRISSFNHVLNAQGMAITASPDGSRVYVGGDFTTVDGVARSHIAAFDTATGALNTSFKPVIGGQVRALTVTNDTVYAGGAFQSAGGQARGRLASFSASNGAMNAWAPQASDGYVWSMVVTPDHSKVVVGGQFTTLSGTSVYGMGAVDAVSGALVPWAANQTIHDSVNGAITSLVTDGTQIYGTGFAFGSGASFEGQFALNPADGTINWLNDCQGDNYDVMPIGQVLYAVNHSHNCEMIGAFPQTDPWSINERHAQAFTTYPTTTNKGPDQYGWNYNGIPAAQLLTWYPQMYTGSYTGQGQAAWSVTGNDQYIALGGEFPGVNYGAQQGLVRFAVKAVAPNKRGPELKGVDFTPRARSVATGTARVSWQAVYDMDNAQLDYKVIRDGDVAHPVYTTSATSSYWTTPTLGFTDQGLTPGQTYTYQVYASDPFGNTGKSTVVSVTVSNNGTLSPYAAGVLNDGAQNYWRLGEPSGSTAMDYAGFSDVTLNSGTTRGLTGAIGGDSDAATGFNGSSSGFGASSQQVAGPQTFSVEAWFKTSSNRGGKIVGFGNSQSGNSGSYDRHIYLTNSGQVVFGVYPGGVRTITSPGGFNNNQWHHVVGTLGAGGMTLYLDGKRQGSDTTVTSAQSYTGYWRIGGDNLGGWPGSVSSSYLNGTIDDVAVYPGVLSLTQVRNHYINSGRTLPGMRPADVYGQTVYDTNPDLYWRLGETSGSTVTDASPNQLTGTYSGGVTKGVTGAVTGTSDTAVTFDGVSGIAAASTQVNNPRTYSEELWFKTGTHSGGKLIGFGNSNTGLSDNYDRHVYMLDTGQLNFGTWTGQENLATSPKSYNDNVWHHMVATQDSGGMKLYVDGQLVASNPQTSAQDYSGYWRVGGDTTWEGSSSPYFAGSIDEVAVYSTALSDAQVQDHYLKGGGTVPNAAPTAGFTSTVSNLQATFDSSTSADTDGSIASYAWDFGDGSSDSIANPIHTYGAAGTYHVTLTVTDDDGATGSVTHDVTVTAPPANVPPTAGFTSTVSNLQATFDSSTSTDTDGSITGYEWDFGDGTAHGTSASPVHTYGAAGTYHVKLTVTDDDGATGSVTHDVTVTAPPANVPPTAGFTSTVSDLQATFDSSTSTDTDGSITGYEWDFGDGTAHGTSASPVHTYGAAGTYHVKLTVTDNDGATGSVTHDVTVTAPVGGTLYAQDAFGRSLASGWGSADVGGPWSLTGGAANFSVGSGVGQVVAPAAGRRLIASLGSVSQTETEVFADLSLDKAQTGGGTYVSLIGRQKSLDNDYRVKLRFYPNGVVSATAQSVVGGASSNLASVFVPGVTYSAGDVLRVRLQVTGTSPTTVRAKVWDAAGTEPASWTVSATDSTSSLQSAGAVGLEHYLSGTATNAPMTLSVDNYSAGPVDGTPPPPPVNQAPTASFVWTADQLQVTYTGDGSSDPDGSIASYDWDFGDGTSHSTAANPVHTYGAAGTYQVKLTVTDNDGATDALTQDVTVSDVVPTVYAQDAFGRSLASGWGSADVGGPWSLTGGTGNFSVAGGAGRIVAPSAGQTMVAWLPSVASTDTEVSADFSLDKAQTGGGSYVSLIGRQITRGNDYRVKLRFYPNGVVSATAQSVVGGASSNLASVFVPGVTYSAGDVLRVRLQVTGTSPTTVRAKVWNAAGTEPASWTVTTTDSTSSLQAAGAVGLDDYLSGTATNAPMTLSVDNYSAGPAN